MVILKILGIIVFGLIASIVIVLLIVCAQYVFWFHLKRCKNCKHRMVYKGMIEDHNEEYYLFHCSDCGTWEKIERAEFFRDVDKK